MKLSLKPMIGIVAVFAALCAPGAQTGDADEPVTIVSHVDIIPDAHMPQSEETAATLFRTEEVATKQESGLVSYVVLQQTMAPNHFSIVETWRNEKAYDMHLGSAHTVKFRRDIQPYLGSPFDSRMHHQLR